MFRRHALQNNFTNFAFFAIFQVSFFILITTIGLNIIFGIIVDTFSELRDLKVEKCYLHSRSLKYLNNLYISIFSLYFIMTWKNGLYVKRMYFCMVNPMRADYNKLKLRFCFTLALLFYLT